MKKVISSIGMVLLVLLGLHHVRAGEVDESTNRYCVFWPPLRRSPRTLRNLSAQIARTASLHVPLPVPTSG
jgi:hypothetical protein